MPIPNANVKLSKNKKTIKLIKAIPITVGTKKNDILSANLEIGALELDASSTNLIIVFIVVSFPTLVALIFK